MSKSIREKQGNDPFMLGLDSPSKKNGTPKLEKTEVAEKTTEDPFMLGVEAKKKEISSQEPVTPSEPDATVSQTGTENISPSPSELPSEKKETKKQRYQFIEQASAGDIVEDYKLKLSAKAKSLSGNPLEAIKATRDLNDFMQSREAKVGKIATDIIERGQFNKEDINYMVRVAPNAAKQIIGAILPDSTPQNIISTDNINRLLTEGKKIVDKQITQNKVAQSVKINDNANKSLQAIGIQPEQLQNDQYASQINEGVTSKRSKELSDLEKKYPEKATFSDLAGTHYERPNEFKYLKEKIEINKKYDDIQNKIGVSKAFSYAKANPTLTPLQIGEEWLKYANPDTYKLWVKGGKKGAINRDIAEVGVRALYGNANPASIELAKADEQTLDDQYPDKKISEVYHRLGAELYKNQNWFFNAAPSVKQLDEAAKQLPEKEREFYYKHIREYERKNFGTDVPMSGLVNKIGEGVGSTAIETWKGLGDLLNVRSDKKVASEALNEGYDTDYKDVGTYGPAKQRLTELNNKQKKGEKLTDQEISEKHDLETYTGVRSTAQEIIDGTGNLTGQVIFQALGTKGLGSAATAGVRATGLLKGAQVASGLATEEAIAAKAFDFGISKAAITDISASAIAFASSYDAAKRDAFRLMPDDKDAGKRTLYATIVGGLNAGTERIFKDEKILDAFNTQISPSIKALVGKLEAGEISKEALAPAITNILKKSGAFTTEMAKANLKESTEEFATSVGESIATSILAPTKFNEQQAFNDAVSTFTTTFLHGGLVSGAAAINGYRSNHISIPTLSKLGIDETLTQGTRDFINGQLLSGNMTQEEVNGKFQILNTAAKINTDVMPKVSAIAPDLPQKAKEKYSVQLLNEKILSAQAEETKDPVLKSALEEKVKESEKIRKQILNKEIFVDDDYSLVSEAQVNAIESGEGLSPEDVIVRYAKDGKLSVYSKMVNDNPDVATDVLRDVAQQVYGITSTGDPLEGGSREGALSLQFSTDVLEAAKKKFPTPESTLQESGTPEQAQPEEKEIVFPARNDDFVRDRRFFSEVEEYNYHKLIDEGKEDAARQMISDKKQQLLNKTPANESKKSDQESGQSNAKKEGSSSQEDRKEDVLKQKGAAESVEETAPLTQEAKDLLDSIKEGSKPTFITKNLEKIAKDNGIEITGETTADDIISALRKKAENIQVSETDFNHPKWDGTELWQRPYMGDSGADKVKTKAVSEKGKMVDQFDPSLMQKKMIEDALANGQYEKEIEAGRMTASDAKIIIESVGAEVPQDILIDAGVESEKAKKQEKPKVRVSAEQLQAAQPKEESKPKEEKKKEEKTSVSKKTPTKEDLSKQLKDLLGGKTLSSKVSPHSRVSFDDIGLTEGDSIESAIDKLIAYGGEFTDIFKAIKADPNLKNVKLELVKRLPSGDLGLYHPVGIGEGKDGLLQVSNIKNVYYTAAHELLHFFTLDSQVAEQVKDSSAYKAIEDIYNFIASQKGKPVPVAGNVSVENYGLTDVKEFMAEMFINPDFRKYVSDVFAANKEEIIKQSKALKEASKSGSIVDIIADLLRELFSKIFSGKNSDIPYNEQKSAIDNAVQIATDLFFGDKNKKVGLREPPRSELEKRVDELFDGTHSSTEILKGLNDLIEDKYLNEMSKYLYPYLDKNKNIKYTKLKVPGVWGATFHSGNWTINLSYIREKEQLLKTVVHELFHAISINELRNNDSYKKDIDGMVKKVREKLGISDKFENIKDGLDFQKSGIDINNYGLINAEEFIAEIFSNQEFAKIVDSVKFDEKNSLLDKFVNWVKKILGIKSETKSSSEVIKNRILEGLSDDIELLRTPEYLDFIIENYSYKKIKPLLLPSFDSDDRAFETSNDDYIKVDGPVISEKEANKLLEDFSKKTGIEGVIEDLGELGPLGKFEPKTIKVKVNRLSGLDKKGKGKYYQDYTGNYSRRNIFHEYLHPFISILNKKNNPLFNEILKEAIEKNNTEKFIDEEVLKGYSPELRNEEMVVRYMDRLSDMDKPPSLFKKFIDFISSFFYSKRENTKSDLKTLSPDTTVQELYDVFKNYGNLKEDYIESRKRTPLDIAMETVDRYEKYLTDPSYNFNEKEKEFIRTEALPEARRSLEKLSSTLNQETNRNKVQSLFDEKHSTTEILIELNKIVKDKYLEKQIGYLLPYLKKHPEIKFAKLLMEDAKGIASSTGIWSAKLRRAENEKELLKTVVHEVYHAISIEAIFRDRGFNRQISDLVKEAIDKLEVNHLFKRKVDFGDPQYRPYYGLSDPYEFVSEIFSNQDFAKMIDSLKDGKQSLLSKFFEAIKIILGLSKTNSEEIKDFILSELKSKSVVSKSSTSISEADDLRRAHDPSDFIYKNSNKSSTSAKQLLTQRVGNKIAGFKSPDSERSAIISDFVKYSLEQGATPEDIKDALIDNGLSEQEAQSFIDNNVPPFDTEVPDEQQPEEEKPSGIRKALVSSQLIADVNLNKISDKDMMALGRKILDSGEVKPEALVRKILKENVGVLTPAEVVGMITYKADLDNSVRDAYKQFNENQEAGEDTGTLGVEIADLEQKIHDFDVAAVITANQQSLAFRLRQYMLDRDYNVTTQIEKYKKNNNGYIPPEVEARFRELDRELKAVKDKLTKAEKKLAEKEDQQAVDNIAEDVAREKLFTQQELEQKIKEGVQKEIDDIHKRLSPEKKNLANKAIEALDKFQKKLRGKSYADTGIVAFVDAGITVIKNAIKAGVAVADAVEMGIGRIKELLAKKGVSTWTKEDEFRQDMLEGFEAEGVSTSRKPKDKATINDDGSVTIPNQMLRDLVERGLTTIEELTDAVHAEVVKDLPNVTKRQVRDYITDYGKTINPSADEIQQQLNTAKRVGRLLSELEDLQNQKRKDKSNTSRYKLSQKEKELKRKIRILDKGMPLSDSEKDTKDKGKLAASKERVKNKIAELEERLKNKDFAKKKKVEPIKDQELIDLETQKEKLQEEFDKEQYKAELKQRTWWKKVEDVALELTSGLVRGLVASVDLSAGFVQGLWRLFSNPQNSMNAFGTMFKHLVSEKGSKEYMTKLKASPEYNLMRAAKLAIDDQDGKASAKEGLFISNWINHIWNFMAKVISLNNPTVKNFIKKINPYEASKRAFDGYVNSIRVQSFVQLAKQLEDKGYTFESDPEVYKKAADFVNTTTGRASLGAIESNSRWLNTILFAPRKVASEVKLFTPYAFAYYAKMPPAVRRRALINLSKFLGGFFLTNSLAWAALKDDDDEDDNFWNPTSSDFLTHKIGNKRISIAGGAKSMITFQSRLLTGKFTDQYGKTTKLGERFGKPINSRFDLFVRFILGKASPAIAVAAKKLDEKKGMEVDDSELIKDVTVPMWMQDLKDLYKDDPVAVGVILSTLAFFGANTRVVPEKPTAFKKEELKDPTLKYFIERGAEMPETKPGNIEIPDEAEGKIKKLADYGEEKVSEFNDYRKEALKEELSNLKETGHVYVDKFGRISTTDDGEKEETSLDDLTEDQWKKVMSIIGGKATKKAKQETFKTEE